MRATSYNFKIVLAVAACWLMVWSARAQIIITNAGAVNITPCGFSIVATVSPAITSANTPVISVFSDPGGTTNLAGQVGVEFYPLNSGDPAATNGYQNFLSRAALRQDSMSLGLIYARISSCMPGTTYYYQITVTNAGGQKTVWPASGPLPAVTTAQENSFVLQSQQLLITVNDTYPPGSIITLTTSNSPSVLAAVVGDGAGNNQVFFNLNDLIAAAGGTNYAPVGNQTFAASVLSRNAAALTQNYNLTFSNNFAVGQYGAGALGALDTTISLGTSAMLVGSTGSVPISVDSQAALAGLSFVITFPANLFTAFSVQPTAPSLSGASLSVLSANSVRLTFSAVAGQSFHGSQQLAQLNLTAASNQPSTFVPLLLQLPQGTNTDASLASQFSLKAGRAVIIGTQSLLDLQPAGGGFNLVLYGTPGQGYQIQSSTNLAGGWSDFAMVPMTNLAQVFPNVDSTAAARFFRAYSFAADPPILLASLNGGARSLLTYGIPGTNYTLLTSTNLAIPTGWSPLVNYTMSNSFQYFTNLGNSAPVFYRLRKQ